MSKLKLGLYWAASCGGCDIATLEIHEKVLDLLEVAEIAFWPCVLDFKYADVAALPDGALDVCLFNGAVRNDENEHVARLLRRKSKALVAYGACAHLGGIPGLGNLVTREAILRRAFVESESTDNAPGTIPGPRTELGDGRTLELPALQPQVRALRQVVDVDYFVPGCPPTAEQTWAVIEAVASGALPPPGAVVGAGDAAVCDECPFEKRDGKVARFRRIHEVVPDGHTCLLEQGVVCLGPATRSGCGAQCLNVNMPCRGCYGPAGDVVDQGAKMIAAIGSVLESEDAAVIQRCVDELADPAGTFYRFGLPTSLLGRSRA